MYVAIVTAISVISVIFWLLGKHYRLQVIVVCKVFIYNFDQRAIVMFQHFYHATQNGTIRFACDLFTTSERNTIIRLEVFTTGNYQIGFVLTNITDAERVLAERIKQKMAIPNFIN